MTYFSPFGIQVLTCLFLPRTLWSLLSLRDRKVKKSIIRILKCVSHAASWISLVSSLKKTIMGKCSICNFNRLIFIPTKASHCVMRRESRLQRCLNFDDESLKQQKRILNSVLTLATPVDKTGTVSNASCLKDLKFVSKDKTLLILWLKL